MGKPQDYSTASGPPPCAHDLVEAAEDSDDPFDERHDDTDSPLPLDNPAAAATEACA